MANEQIKKNGWSLDRKTLVLCAMILSQVIGFTWVAAKLDSRSEANAQWIERNRQSILNLPRIEERLANICTTLGRIEEQVRDLQKR